MKLGLTKAFKRLEPDDGKLSSPVLRGRRRWQHLFCYLTVKILLLCSVSYVQAQEKSASKPELDLQKVYQEALTWSKTELEAMPDTKALQSTVSTPGTASTSGTASTAGIGVCRGTKKQDVLEITSSCKKKNQQEVNEADQEVTEEQGVREPQDKILVFVSFSMPKQSLVALSTDAQKHDAVLVMRGLKDDSFKETQAAFQELGKDMQSGIEINPEAFETYQIKQVPVFVRVKSTPTHGKDFQEVSRLSGNVSLAFAAKKLKEQS